jgi:thymidylate synthase ThyX
MPRNHLDVAYFEEEYCRFREMMGNKKYTMQDLDRGLDGLGFVLMNLKLETSAADMERCTNVYDALVQENARRNLHRTFLGVA